MPDYAAELRRRMARTQRHRLLQGYPMAPLMKPVRAKASLDRVPFDDGRPLIVGVLPHPFCNPQVRGCGFCTFPHQSYKSSAAGAVASSVADEIRAFARRRPGVSKRRVDGVYFGGGTATLTPPDAFARLCAELSNAFTLEHAEVTLEGVPVHFLARAELLDILERELACRHRRLSMGVQTFDRAQLARMGRTAFGTREEIAQVVARAHARGMTASADLLCNLPGQTLEEMRADIRTAAAIGFDQICLYHLVLVPDLPVPWAQDRSILDALPDMATAFANWRALRELLLELGFVQATLTNFERAEVHASSRRFVYEACSFDPGVYDGVGFGPEAISCFSSPNGQSGVKWINASDSEVYRKSIAAHGQAPALLHEYDDVDMRLLHLTRSLPLLSISRAPHRDRFGIDLVEEFAGEIAALSEAGLVAVGPDRLALTVAGMFFADSVAGLLAWVRASAVRDEVEALAYRMG